MLVDTQQDSSVPVQIVDGDQSPVDADAPPTWRLYDGNMGLVTSGTLSLAKSGSVADVTNADPAVVTSAAHGLTTGTRVKIASVGGATGANGSWTITRLDADTFSVDVSGAPGAYTSGGSWNVLGLYEWAVDSSLRSQLEPGRPYTLFVDYALSSVAKTLQKDFIAA